MALLFDTLLRPDTDFGGSVESILTWRHQKERAIPHLVLGRNPPGGAWHVSGARMGCGDLCQTSLMQVRTLALPTFPYSPPLLPPPSPSPPPHLPRPVQEKFCLKKYWPGAQKVLHKFISDEWLILTLFGYLSELNKYTWGRRFINLNISISPFFWK